MSEQPEIISTGIAGLDTILGGGLSRNALAFVVGPPGAGKTILATQIVFAAVRAGSPALILTAFSEDHSKLLGHLRSLSFFDDSAVGTHIQLLTLGSLIGVDGQLDNAMVIQTVRQTGARMIMLDGFQSIPDLFAEPVTVRRLLDSLAKLAQVLRVSVLVTMEGDGRDVRHGPALTMADVVIDLNYQVAGWRHTRQLDVLKQRGRPALPGLHSYTITSDGIVVYPRLESQLPQQPVRRANDVLAFGIAELDSLLSGGIPASTAAVLLAAPGAGKTTLALHWALAEARPEQSSLFLTFQGDQAQLEAKAVSLGLDLAAAVASSTCRVIHVPPVAIDPDAVAALLLEAMGPTTRRVIIDDLGGLIWELGTRARDYLAALSLHLAHHGVTTLLLLEAGQIPPFRLDTIYALIAPIAETVIALEEQVIEDQVQHMARLVTSRFGAYTPRQRTTMLSSVRRTRPEASERSAEV
jgi:circadian clock protein KaiC